MLPWSAFGHIIPFSLLAVSLVRSGFVRVSFLSTSRNLRRIPAPPQDVKDAAGSLLRGEATMDVAFNKIPYLKIAYDLLRKPLMQILAASSRDVLMVDFTSPWAKDLVSKASIPMMMFSIFSASMFAFVRNSDYLAGEQRWEMPESLTIPHNGGTGQALWVIGNFIGLMLTNSFSVSEKTTAALLPNRSKRVVRT